MSIDTNKYGDEVKKFFNRQMEYFSKKSSPDGVNKVPLSYETEPNELVIDDDLRKEVEKVIREENAIERVRKLFVYDEKTGSLSREIHHIESNVKLVGIVGFFIGGLNETYKHTENFNRNNQLMLYSNKKDATKAMANFILMKTVKGGLFLSLKFATFVGLGLGLPTMLNVYRNKTSPVNYIIGMSLTGGLFRMHCGMYSLLAGTLAGSIIGGIYGTAEYTLRKSLGILYEDFKFKEVANKIIFNRKLSVSDVKNDNKEERVE